jgi:uncharacterized protein
MILNVKFFKEGVSEPVETVYDPRELDLEFVDFHYLTKVGLKGIAERIRQTVTFRGTLTFKIEQICARCLDRIESAVSSPFDLSYNIEGREQIDSTDDLRDILILNHPERFLCRKDCKGICPGCGTNLNHEPCRCSLN